MELITMSTTIDVNQIVTILLAVIAILGGATSVRYRNLAGKLPKLRELMKQLDEAMKAMTDEKGELIDPQKLDKERLEKIVKEFQDVYGAMKELLKE